MLCALAAACGGHHASQTSPNDPISRIPVSPLPVASASGSNVLLLTVGGLVLGDTVPLPALEGRRGELMDRAYAVLDSTLRVMAREVEWQGLEEQRATARRNPTLGLNPDRFATAFTIDPGMDRLPDPLWTQVRTLAAVTSARFAVMPAGVRIAAAEGGFRADYVLVAADARTGTILWRGRSTGRAVPTPEAALVSAASFVAASPLQFPTPPRQ